MSFVRRSSDLARDLLQTAFRLFPWPTRTGLRRIGNPGRHSPVLVTGNYDLTVRRLLRELAGVDAWLLVASSRGVNVWCAAAGGLFGTPQVVTALKTSGIGDLVDHRQTILPQLAATGVEARAVKHRTGWSVRFGPVEASDLPRYLKSGRLKSEEMHRVQFGTRERFEMTAAWAAPASLPVIAVGLALRPSWVLPLLLLTWTLALAVFFLFEHFPGPRRTLLTAAAVAIAGGVAAMVGLTPAAVLVVGGIAALLAMVVSFDYQGSTPIEASPHLAEEDFRITLEIDRCVGAYRCIEVCPEAVFAKREEARLVELAHSERCIRCAACIVQCPQDALYFESRTGTRIEPATVRRFKLNLLGQRTLDRRAAGAGPAAPGK